jgi:outer membrane protein OmpA-like peptidoglycan-associated protein
MKLWRARLKNPVSIDGPPASASKPPIRQDCIEQAHLFLSDSEADQGYLVSLHQVEVHDWDHVGTRQSLHTSDLLGRIKGTLYARVMPYEPPPTEKTKLEKLFKQEKPSTSTPLDQPLQAQSADSNAQKGGMGGAPVDPANDNTQGSSQEKNQPNPNPNPNPNPSDSVADSDKPKVECAGCNFWLTLWVALSVWFLCDWKMALIAIVPLVIRCLSKPEPGTVTYGWVASICLVALAWAMSFYGYRWTQETRCDELYPWWLWVIALLIVLTRYLKSCIPWLLVVLIWNYSLVLVCRADGQSCMLDQESSAGFIGSIYDKVTQNIRDKLDRDSNTQIATSQPANDLKGGRISVEQALGNTEKYFTCPADGSEGPKFNIYFGQEAIFGYADTTISPDARPHLRKLVTLLKRRPNDHIIITGHADKTGSPVGNMKLSEKRAYALADWLVETQAIPADQITVVGAGDMDPLVNLSTDIPLNRRVEVRINCKNRS